MSNSDESAGSGDKPARIHDKLFKDVFKGPEYVTSLIEVTELSPEQIELLRREINESSER